MKLMSAHVCVVYQKYKLVRLNITDVGIPMVILLDDCVNLFCLPYLTILQYSHFFLSFFPIFEYYFVQKHDKKEILYTL